MMRWSLALGVLVGALSSGCTDGDALDQALTGSNPQNGATDGGPDAGDARVMVDDAGRAPPQRDATPSDATACRPETCNGIDDDCDGRADEEADRPCGPEAPVGICLAGTERCVEGFLQECRGARLPREEICDTLDNDCDGAVDEVDCPGCMPGAFQPCYSGTPPTLNVGPCQAGIQTCGAEGRFGLCDGEIAPEAEVCNGLDDDCDGAVDEDFAADVGAECSVGVGTCARIGLVVCDPEGLRCSATPDLPADEQCNGLDDDCDGRADEDFGVGEPCSMGEGACRRMGETACGDGAGTRCTAEAAVPAGEICNAQDDDCDGRVDEGREACYGGPAGTQGVGRCRAGSRPCDGACVDEVRPAAEVCNGMDEDCDGRVDERDGAPCQCNPGQRVGCFEGPGAPGVGRCREGSRTCREDGTFGPCQGAVAAVAERCNDVDDDCDGATDESLAQACGDAAQGRCRPGQQVCDNGAWGACVGSVGPRAEVCNDLDDDCDGTVDDGLTRACGTDLGACRAGTETCARGAWGACAGEIAPQGEVCDGDDQDCDGRTDEGVLNACDDCGAVPVEVCNEADDDCDGMVDERVQNACGGCGPVPGEVCNGQDEDCDGAIDEDTPPDCEPCVVDADCPAEEVSRWSVCAYPSACATVGGQSQTTTRWTCEDNSCLAAQSEAERACARETEGNDCGGTNVCVEGACTRTVVLSAENIGAGNAAARHRVTCAFDGANCVVEALDGPCQVRCPEGARFNSCCSNGGDCGGSPVAPNPRAEVDSLRIIGAASSRCSGLGVDTRTCLGMLGAANARSECTFSRNGGIE